jgi:hypothetical protein
MADEHHDGEGRHHQVARAALRSLALRNRLKRIGRPSSHALLALIRRDVRDCRRRRGSNVPPTGGHHPQERLCDHQQPPLQGVWGCPCNSHGSHQLALPPSCCAFSLWVARSSTACSCSAAMSTRRVTSVAVLGDCRRASRSDCWPGMAIWIVQVDLHGRASLFQCSVCCLKRTVLSRCWMRAAVIEAL